MIIGQDPYHKVNQAHGLSFSVNPDIKIPPSLVNIFKELKDDLGCELPNNGFLKSWANQGVLLLNSILSVEEGKPGSHANRGWEVFTDKLIEVLNKRKELVFILWGNYALTKGHKVDRDGLPRTKTEYDVNHPEETIKTYQVECANCNNAKERRKYD